MCCAVVVEVEFDPVVGVPAHHSWWDVPVAEISASRLVRDARREYETQLDHERRFI